MANALSGPAAAEKHRDLIDGIALRFGVAPVKQVRPDLLFVGVDRADAPALITHLKEMQDFTHLAFFTAVDRIEEGKFELKYMLHNYKRNLDLCVSVFIARDSASMDTISHLWPAAITYEQELAEMFGIDFPRSPRVGQSFILESWEGMPPMRRDFDTRKYSEETFYARPGRATNDTRDHMQNELYPSEAERW